MVEVFATWNFNSSGGQCDAVNKDEYKGTIEAV